MRTNHFELSVVGASEEAATGTVTLAHGQTFKVALTNHLPRRRCNVRLSFNGKDAGEYRVPGGQTVVIKRPVSDETPFTFLQLGTAEAKVARLLLDDTAGVLAARFLPGTSSEKGLVPGRWWRASAAWVQRRDCPPVPSAVWGNSMS